MKFTAIDYISAALALEIFTRSHNLPLDDIDYPTTVKDAKSWLEIHYPISNNEIHFEDALNRLSELRLISIDIDPYAGGFVSVDWGTFHGNFEILTSKFPNSPYNRAQRGGRSWLYDVFQNEKYWQDLEVNHDILLIDRDITEPDHIIEIEQNENYQELMNGLTRISDDLLRDNEISEHLGDDKERIKIELEASKTILTAKDVRKSVAVNLVANTLKELITKLKDKFADKLTDYGVEKLLNFVLNFFNN